MYIYIYNTIMKDFFLLIIGFISALTTANRNERQLKPRLEIFPNQSTFTLSVNDGSVIRCMISGLGPQVVDVNIKWFDPNGQEVTEVHSNIRRVYIEKESLSPVTKLFFKGIQPSDAGRYTCRGIVEGNEQYESVSVELYKEITFDNAPTPQFKILHSTALIECKVSGNPIPRISWKHKGARILSNFRYSQDVYGLTIKNITKHDEGLYYCEAEVDKDGRYKYVEIDVIIQVPPKIDTSILEFTGTQSYEYSLPCRAKGSPPPRFEFFKDGNLNPLHTTDRRQYDPEGGELVFRPLHEEDRGIYTCRAFNNAGEDVLDFKLVVLVPPSIYSLYNVTQVENKTVDFVCKSYGDPAPVMTFRKAGGAIPEMKVGDVLENGRIEIKSPERGELVMRVNSLVPDDMSNYTCVSFNDGGKHERNGTITVQFAPRFLPDNVRSLYIWPGKTRNITCQTRAEPMPSFEWVLYPSLPMAIYNNETYKIHIMGKNSNLQVTVRERDQNWIYGNYTCRATNQYGRSELKIDLIKARIPGPPKEVLIANLTSDSVVLVPTPPEDNGGEEIISYRIDFEARVLVFPLGDRIWIENLRPSTSFFFAVRAESAVGHGDPRSVMVRTEDVKTPSKLLITSSPISTQPFKYMITWAKPITGGLPIREYEFKFRKVNEKGSHEDWNTRRRQDDESRPMMSYLLEGLKSGSEYQIEVRARNDLGHSVPNDPFFFTTVPDKSESTDPDSTTSATVDILLLLLLLCCCRFVNAF